MYIRDDGLSRADFDQFDYNHDGSLDAKEIQDMLALMGLNPPIEEIEQKIKEAGGSNGRVTYEQLVNAMNSGI